MFHTLLYLINWVMGLNIFFKIIYKRGIPKSTGVSASPKTEIFFMKPPLVSKNSQKYWSGIMKLNETNQFQNQQNSLSLSKERSFTAGCKEQAGVYKAEPPDPQRFPWSTTQINYFELDCYNSKVLISQNKCRNLIKQTLKSKIVTFIHFGKEVPGSQSGVLNQTRH